MFATITRKSLFVSDCEMEMENVNSYVLILEKWVQAREMSSSGFTWIKPMLAFLFKS